MIFAPNRCPSTVTLALTLAACSGPSWNRDTVIPQAGSHRLSFAIADITASIPWAKRNQHDGTISLEPISPQQFIERTGIVDLQLNSFLPGHITGFELLGAGASSDGRTLVSINIHTDISEKAGDLYCVIEFLPNGKLLSLTNTVPGDPGEFLRER